MSKSAVIPFPVQAPSAKASQALPLFASYNLGQPIWSPVGIDSFIDEGYAKNWVLFTAVNDIATSAAAIPLYVYSRKDDTVIPDHPVTRLLRRPSPFSTDVDFFTAVYAFYKIAGNSYLEWSSFKETGEGEVPEELYCLPPNYMKVIAGKLFVAGYEFEYNGQKKRYQYDIIQHKSRVCHWKTFNPKDNWYGMSACEAAAMSMDTHNKAGAWNKALLDNGARPSGALVYSPKGDDVDDTLTDEQYKALKTRMEENWSGASNRGRPILLEGGLQWQQMSLSPADLDFLQGRNTDAIGIANALDYPPFLLGLDTGQATFNNVAEARMSLYEDSVLPMVGSLAKKMTNWLSPYFGDDWYIGYDEDEVPALQPKRDALWERLQKADWMTINEKRRETRLEPVKGGDVILVPGISVPLGEESSEGSTAMEDEKGFPFEAKSDNWSSWMYEMGYGINWKDRDSTERNKQLRLQKQFLKTYLPKVEAHLEKEAKAIGSGYASNGTKGVASAIKKSQKELEKLLTIIYKRVMPVSGERIFDALKGQEGDFEIKSDSQTLFETNILAWIEDHALEQAKEISKATEKKARSILVDSATEGLGARAVSAKLREELGNEFAKNRADKIARTEIHQAFNKAGQEAAEASGVKMNKKWLSAQDERTRDTHKAVNGDTVGLKKTFNVGGSQLMFPGDPSGAASEVINCRCAMRYIPAGV